MEHMDRLERVERELEELRPKVVALQTDISYIKEAVDSLARKHDKAFPWGPMISGAALLVMILGGYTTLLTAPMQADIDANRVHIFENDDNDQRTHSELIDRVGRLEGRMDAAQDDIDRIDTYGSRRWNKQGPYEQDEEHD